jgi:peptidoglycan/xylan/chitin deacetylase (PgdA/CDA1 family)
MGLRSSLIFRLLKVLTYQRPSSVGGKVLYLTFDDGPEPEITEFVIEELARHNCKATFFCCGENVVKFPDLVQCLRDEGHLVANHTFSHINGLHTRSDEYCHDVEKANTLINSVYFRPPWGALSLRTYLRLKHTYKIVLRDVVSNDTCKGPIDVCQEVDRMKSELSPGKIILFHFSRQHSEHTKLLLPKFMNMALQEGYSFSTINK